MTALLLLESQAKDLGGGFMVRRSLPSAKKQSVGPFVFFDHFGPVLERPEDNHDVRPHPHIGLSTVTYLIEGAMMHRDSLGTEQRIEPGAINWMTAGRGIVHSERAPQDLRGTVRRIHGLQLWAALPEAHEEAEPSFTHTASHEIPRVELPGASLRVLIGSFSGAVSPVRTYSPTLYLDVTLAAGASIELPREPGIERGVYAVEGAPRLDGAEVPACTLAVTAAGEAAQLATASQARVFVIGGEALAARRHMWWNFVSTRRERIEQAKQDWRAQRMGTIPGETEWIPLPE